MIVNELRGEVCFSDDGYDMLESYKEADLGGQQNSAAFRGADATVLSSIISTDGTLRLARGGKGAVFVYRRMPPGALTAWLDENLLPTDGGTYLGNPTWKGPVERAPNE